MAGRRERLHRIREFLNNVLQPDDHVFELGDFSPCRDEEWFCLRIGGAPTTARVTASVWRTPLLHAHP